MAVQVEWSEKDQEYVATIPEFPLLSWLHPCPEQARAGLEALLADVEADLRPPTPPGDAGAGATR